ncbi:MAG: hypothetical protein HY727_12715 [Candidatus Rokubacteria bacterium]|nr:hypothetical protein [Candidatus Rokubacteria bacterium]
MFSGGDYEEVARWLLNFLTSHAKRENPRIEVVFDAGPEREGKSYTARLRLRDRLSDVMELDFGDVADNRGNLAWCAAMAERTRALARALGGARQARGAGIP